MKPSWNEYLMNIATVVATRSCDIHTQVGCVIVSEGNRIKATGYNSFPAGVDDEFWPTTRESEVLGNVWSENGTAPYFENLTASKYDIMCHAEQNAISSSETSLKDCILYSTLFPCNACAKSIITAGIKKVYYIKKKASDSHKISELMMFQAKIEMIQVDSSEKP